MKALFKPVAAIALAASLSGAAGAQRDFSQVEITVQQARGNIYTLFGAGGNIGVSIGDEGVFLIDDQFAPLTDKIVAALATLTDKPVKYVINTHYHGDHTGGNENLGKRGAIILAHDNVHKRVLTRVVDAMEKKGDGPGPASLPVISFSENLSLYINGDEARAVHVRNAHTDGDSLIHFKGANVLHMGDTFFLGRLPYIDAGAGGSLVGAVAAIDTALGLADADTVVIPGHGPLAGKDDLAAYKAMLEDVQGILTALKATGISQEDAVAQRPLDSIGERWLAAGPEWTDRFIGFVWQGL